MTEMTDMGYKMKDSPMTASPSEGKDKTQYPTLNLYKKVPSDIASKDVGDMCRFEIVGKIISKAEREEGNDITIEIHKMGYIASADKKSKDEYIDMNDKEREDYDKKDVGADEKE